jgi:hypothetical protein
MIFVLLTAVSCTNKKSTNNLEQAVFKITEEEAFLKHFEIESVVPIETNDNFLISIIKKVIYEQDNIIILTTNSCIFVIDSRTGKAKSSIERKGKGPGESRTITDITFDAVSRNIIAMNDYDKLLFFNLNGDFLYEDKVKFCNNIVYDNGNVILYEYGEGISYYPYYIDVYNLKNKTLVRKGTETKIDFPLRQYGRQMVRSKNIWFTSPLGYQIGEITKDYDLKFPYILEPKKRITEDLIKLAASDGSLFRKRTLNDDIIYGMSSVRETDNFILFKINTRYFVTLNKNTLTATAETVYDKDLGISLLNYYPHDGDDNRIMFIVQPDEWLERKKNENIPPYLQSLVDSVQVGDDSNPILIYYREKK